MYNTLIKRSALSCSYYSEVNS